MLTLPNRTLLGVLALTLLAALPVFADSSYSAVGLSAAPDHYDGELVVPYGDTFSLYVIVTGPDAGALPFELETIEWALLNSCCGGSPAQYVSTVMNGGMTHEGEASFAVSSVAESCVSGDLVLLAEVEFNWLYEPAGPFHLGAAALGPASDCEGELQILTGLPLRIVPTGITPAENATWGAVKAMFR